jgi:3-methyladenine DNA glycosylase AlkD
VTRPTRSPSRTASAARLALKRLARPVGGFDASRYFGGTADLRFHNVGAVAVRRLARSIDDEHAEWTVDDALQFADALIVDQYLEAKGVGIELLARYRRDFTPRLLTTWKRWLANGHAANWATTDAICGSLIGPTLAAYPRTASTMRDWARHRTLWVRRAAAVSLIPSLRKGAALDVAYHIASALSDDEEDLIQKAVGWMLREAGKRDPARLARYLRQHGPAIPRTTVRYAIERFSPPKRLELLRATRT